MPELHLEQPEETPTRWTEILEDTALENTTAPNSQSLDSLLPALRKQARRNSWFDWISTGLAIPSIFVLAMTVIIFFMMRILDGAWPHVHLDLSLVSFGSTGHSGGAGPGELTVGGIAPALLLAGSSWFASLARRERTRLSQLLAEHDDVQAVGPLVEAITLRNRALTKAASASLMRLLPRLASQDASLLADHQRKLIRQYLDLDRLRPEEGPDGKSRSTPGRFFFGVRDRDLTVAFTEVLARIGDDDDKVVLRRLISNAPDAQTQGAAQASLAAIEARQARERAPDILLRATTENADPGTLLRAAQGAGASDPTELLRSSDDPPM